MRQSITTAASYQEDVLNRLNESASPSMRTDMALLKTVLEMHASSFSVLALAKKIENTYGDYISDLVKFKDKTEFSAR